MLPKLSTRPMGLGRSLVRVARAQVVVSSKTVMRETCDSWRRARALRRTAKESVDSGRRPALKLTCTWGAGRPGRPPPPRPSKWESSRTTRIRHDLRRTSCYNAPGRDLPLHVPARLQERVQTPGQVRVMMPVSPRLEGQPLLRLRGRLPGLLLSITPGIHGSLQCPP